MLRPLLFPIGGVVWFGPNKTITLNAYSGRFGVGNSAVTETEWLASIKKWESLGYKVIAQPFSAK